jgi:hypothetical protein
VSYDISIGGEGFNYTSNLAPLFYEHIPPQHGERGGLHELNGLTGKQACAVLSNAFERIHGTYINSGSTRQFRAKYDAENGWGSTDGALLFLARIMAACHANPRTKVSVWA